MKDKEETAFPLDHMKITPLLVEMSSFSLQWLLVSCYQYLLVCFVGVFFGLMIASRSPAIAIEKTELFAVIR